MVKLIAGVLLLVENLAALVLIQRFYISPYTTPGSPLYHTELFGLVWLGRWFVYAIGVGICAFATFCVMDSWREYRGAQKPPKPSL